jgi:CheY-like chemotaxis protein
VYSRSVTTGASADISTSRPLAGVHILLVDDQMDTLEAICLLLELNGARMTCVGSVEETLASIAEDPPDVLISDLSLPEEDGLSLIRRLRQLPHDRGGRLPAIALTAHANAAMERAALEAGFQRFLRKPIDPGQLLQVLRELLSR